MFRFVFVLTRILTAVCVTAVCISIGVGQLQPQLPFDQLSFLVEIYFIDRLETRVRLTQLSSQHTLELGQLNGWPPTSPVWSSNGNHLAMALTPDDTPRDMYLLRHGKLERITFDAKIERNFAWSHNSQKIAFLSDNIDVGGNFQYSELKVFDVEKQSVDTLIERLPQGTTDLVWSPDGQKLAYAIHEVDHSYISIFNVESLTSDTLDFDNWSIAQPVWSPDSEKLLFISSGPKIDVDDYDIYMMDLALGNLTQLTDTTNRDMNPRLSSDGKKIIARQWIGQTTAVLIKEIGGEERLIKESDLNLSVIHRVEWAAHDDELLLHGYDTDNHRKIHVLLLSQSEIQKIVSFTDTSMEFHTNLSFRP
jgi:Tol biopolymer transport system component